MIDYGQNINISKLRERIIILCTLTMMSRFNYKYNNASVNAAT